MDFIFCPSQNSVVLFFFFQGAKMEVDIICELFFVFFLRSWIFFLFPSFFHLPLPSARWLLIYGWQQLMLWLVVVWISHDHAHAAAHGSLGEGHRTGPIHFEVIIVTNSVPVRGVEEIIQRKKKSISKQWTAIHRSTTCNDGRVQSLWTNEK